MAAKTSWHRYGTKLRHCRLSYMPRPVSISVHVSQVGRSEFCRNRAGYTEILVNNPPPPQMRVIFSGTLSETLDLENFATASRRYNQQNSSTVELSHLRRSTHHGQTHIVYYTTVVCNLLTPLLRFVLDLVYHALVATVVQLLTRFRLTQSSCYYGILRLRSLWL